MDLMNKIRQIERLDQLIRLKATGSPQELSQRLSLSIRHTYRLINELKMLGFPISYNKNQRSYFYTNDVKIHFEIRVEEEKMLNVKGGGFYFSAPNVELNQAKEREEKVSDTARQPTGS